MATPTLLPQQPVNILPNYDPRIFPLLLIALIILAFCALAWVVNKVKKENAAVAALILAVLLVVAAFIHQVFIPNGQFSITSLLRTS